MNWAGLPIVPGDGTFPSQSDLPSPPLATRLHWSGMNELLMAQLSVYSLFLWEIFSHLPTIYQLQSPTARGRGPTRTRGWLAIFVLPENAGPTVSLADLAPQIIYKIPHFLLRRGRASTQKKAREVMTADGEMTVPSGSSSLSAPKSSCSCSTHTPPNHDHRAPSTYWRPSWAVMLITAAQTRTEPGDFC